MSAEDRFTVRVVETVCRSRSVEISTPLSPHSSMVLRIAVGAMTLSKDSWPAPTVTFPDGVPVWSGYEWSVMADAIRRGFEEYAQRFYGVPPDEGV